MDNSFFTLDKLGKAIVKPPGKVYQDWIDVNYPTKESAFLKCSYATLKMCEDFPELKRVRGQVIVGIDFRHHWWCKTEFGEIVDPTAHQWDGSLTYFERDEKEEEPIGECLNCGDLVFRSLSKSSYHCHECY